jgi:uncharacterized membrane protein YidH (DUF202 family)
VTDDDAEDADPGLARERTALAWTRSAIAFAALGVAILRRRPAVGVPVLALSVVIWSLSRLRSDRRAIAVTVAVVALAAVALVITLTGAGAPGLLPSQQLMHRAVQMTMPTASSEQPPVVG